MFFIFVYLIILIHKYIINNINNTFLHLLSIKMIFRLLKKQFN